MNYIETILTRLGVFFLGSVFVYVVLVAVYEEATCIERGTITNIERVDRRIVYVELDNERIVPINQGRFKVGDTHCLKVERKMVYPWE